jgi:hypothetical protein
VRLWDQQAERRQHIGFFATEETAARAYDYAAVQARGPGVKRNFPTEVISGPPANDRTTWHEDMQAQDGGPSKYIGVCRHPGSSCRAWGHARLWDPQTQRKHHIGFFSNEEAAARAYDYAAVQANGRDAKRNFPSNVLPDSIDDIPVAPESIGQQGIWHLC